ncbi:MAG: hypothetical protein P4L41_09580 [Flavipsychrobacter sp.]|nr:hypothetical protein [Flavipsychrobacter sp.]
MQHLKNYPKHLLVLAVSFVMATSAYAQTSSAALTVTQKSGKIFVSDGVSKKVVASAVNNIQPIAAANHVYYINNAVSNKMVIKAYSVADNTTTDVVAAETLNSGTPTDKKITNIIFDGVANRLYFSTVSVNAQGYESYLTWYLDPTNNNIKLFADGKIASVDNIGTIQTELHGVDATGKYTQVHIKAADGTPGALGMRKYTNASPASSN